MAGNRLRKIKNRNTGEIYLEPHHVQIMMDLHSKRDEAKYSYRGFTTGYSRICKKVCTDISREDLHFHNLLDTFAVMRYLETRDSAIESKIIIHEN